MDTQDTVTGQCNHVVGLVVADYPEGRDYLIHAEPKIHFEGEEFLYCPICGHSLGEFRDWNHSEEFIH